ncbi:hypothetical protein KIPB_007184, partial [Kipferlia bialata]|eukprot:g7184.t1
MASESRVSSLERTLQQLKSQASELIRSVNEIHVVADRQEEQVTELRQMLLREKDEALLRSERISALE